MTIKRINISCLLIVFILLLFLISCDKIFVDEKLITSTSVGKIKFGMTYQDVLNSYKDYKYELIKDNDYGGLYIKDTNNENIIRVASDNPDVFKVSENDDNYKIVKIEAYSKDFKTKNGIHPGMTIDELLKIYPDMTLTSGMDGMESFNPSDLTANSYMTIFLTSNDENLLGTYSDESYSTTNFRKEGSISSIFIVDTTPKPVVKETPKPVLSNEDKQMLELVKNGTMPDYDYANISKVFEASFDDPLWSTFETKKGKRIVKFTGKINQELHEIAIRDFKNTYETSKNDPRVKIQAFAGAMSSITGKTYERFMSLEGNPFFDNLNVELECTGIVYQNGNIPYPNCKNNTNSEIYIEKSIDEMFNSLWKSGEPIEVEWTISSDRKSFEISAMNGNSWEAAKLKFNDVLKIIYQE